MAPIDVLVLVACLAMAVFLGREAWFDFYHVATSREEFGHILFVPLGIAFLVWVRRQRLRGQRAARRWIGLCVVCGGLALLRVGDTHMFDAGVHVGALLMVAGCVITFCGAEVVRRFLPAFGAAAFLLPWPGAVLRPVSLTLQHASAVSAEGLLVVLGADVNRLGNVLTLNGQQVAVADACSGLSVLFPTMFIVYVMLFARPLPLGVRGGVFVLTVPLIFVVNALRLVPTAYAYGHLAPATADTVHEVLGWAVLVLVSLLVALGLSQIDRGVPQVIGRPRDDRTPPPQRDMRVLPTKSARARPAVWGLLLLLAIATAVSRLDEPGAAPSAARRGVTAALMALPPSIEGWQSSEMEPPGGLEMLDPDFVWARSYAAPESTTDAFQVMLVQVPDPRRLVGHSVEVCYPSHGFAGNARRRTVSWSAGVDGPTRVAEVVQLPLAGRSALEPSIVVESFWLLATGAIGIDPALLRSAVADRASRPNGAVVAQIVFPGHLAPSVRESLTRETLSLLDRLVLPALTPGPIARASLIPDHD